MKPGWFRDALVRPWRGSLVGDTRSGGGAGEVGGLAIEGDRVFRIGDTTDGERHAAISETNTAG